MRAYAYGIRAVPSHITTTDTGRVPLQVIKLPNGYTVPDLRGCDRWVMVIPMGKPVLETSSQLGVGNGLR